MPTYLKISLDTGEVIYESPAYASASAARTKAGQDAGKLLEWQRLEGMWVTQDGATGIEYRVEAITETIQKP